MNKNAMKKFNASEKLVHRFTLLFSKNFWFLVWNKSYEPPDCLKEWMKYIYGLVFFPMTVLVFIINSILNIVFCTLPALWFVFLLPNILYDENFRKRKTTTTCLKNRQPTSVSEDKSHIQRNDSNIASPRIQLRNTIENICELVLYLLYLFTLREQIGFCIFLLRALCYTIIFGLIAPDFVMRVFIILIASLGYLLSYVLDYIDLYSILLQLVFKIQAETKSKKDEANQIAQIVSSVIEQNGGTNQGDESVCSTIEQNGGANQEIDSISSTIELNGGTNQEIDSVSSTIEQNGGANHELDSEGSTIEQNDRANQEIESVSSTIEQNVGVNQEVERESSTIEQNGDEITEALFNYIVDNCSIVKRSLFLLVVKTFMTCIFLTVTILILRDTGKLQNLNLHEIIPFLVVLISPKVVSIFTAYRTEDDIERHKEEVEKLIEEYH